jgi:hypothetical protein
MAHETLQGKITREVREQLEEHLRRERKTIFWGALLGVIVGYVLASLVESFL